METIVYSIDFDDPDTIGKSGVPEPAAAITVTTRRCVFSSGAPYHVYRVLYENHSSNRQETSETVEWEMAAKEVERLIRALPASYELSLDYTMPPPDPKSQMSRTASELRSQQQQWARQEAEQICQKARGLGPSEECSAEVARASYHRPCTIAGHRVIIVLQRVLAADKQGRVRVGYRLLRKKWRSEGIFGWLVSRRGDRLRRATEPVATTSELPEIKLRLWRLESDLERRGYRKAGCETHAFSQALAAELLMHEQKLLPV